VRPAFRLNKIISGGQTGADQGGLYAARELGIPTGGVAPQDWLTEDGPQRELLCEFGLAECSEPGYSPRTRANVLASDGTLLVGQYRRGGSALTHQIAEQAGKPMFLLEFPSGQDKPKIEEFRFWLRRYSVHTLNVAGDRESQSPGIREFTREFLNRALRRSDAL